MSSGRPGRPLIMKKPIVAAVLNFLFREAKAINEGAK
jgi:hypothetical protein